MLTRWERLEKWLIASGAKTFTVYEVANGMGISVSEASYLINGYLTAQRGRRARTAYVLKRHGRTRAAIWSVGEVESDAHVIGGTLFEDVTVKVKAAFRPDLERLAQQNPEAAPYVEAMIGAVMDGAMKVLAVAVNARLDD